MYYLVWQAITVAEPANTIKALRTHAAEELVFSIPTVQNISGSFQENAARRFFVEAKLSVRTRIIAMPGTTEKGRRLEEWSLTITQIAPHTYVSGVKYVIDETSLKQTALMTKLYPNKSNWYGKLDFPVDTIKQILKVALITDWQLRLYIVGDSATNLVFGLMKEMASNDKWKRKRVRLKHGVGVVTENAAKDVTRSMPLPRTPTLNLSMPAPRLKRNGWLNTPPDLFL